MIRKISLKALILLDFILVCSNVCSIFGFLTAQNIKYFKRVNRISTLHLKGGSSPRSTSKLKAFAIFLPSLRCIHL